MHAFKLAFIASQANLSSSAIPLMTSPMLAMTLHKPAWSALCTGAWCAGGMEGEEREDVLAVVEFDGGLRVPGDIYNRLYDYQKTGAHLFCLPVASKY